MVDLPTCACGCGKRIEATNQRGPAPRYASSACRVRAHRNRRTVIETWETAAPELLADVIKDAKVPIAGRPHAEQVQRALLEARALAFAFQRLGLQARPDLAWRCARMGAAMEQALKDSFGDVAL